MIYIIITNPLESFDKKTGKCCTVTEICGKAGISKFTVKLDKYDQQSRGDLIPRGVFYP